VIEKTYISYGSPIPCISLAEVDGDEKAKLYFAKDIAQHPALQLSTAGLVLIALLAGGDFSVRQFVVTMFL
jgi:hypothetical protein